MRLKLRWWGVLLAAVLGGLVGVTAGAAGGEQFLPVLSIREGARRFVQIPRANGYIDYLTLLNVRDGGINGVPLAWEECETIGDVHRGIECYERLKTQGPTGAAAFMLFDTPLLYALTERATHDRSPLINMGAGRSDATDGRVFPYVFIPPINVWSQHTAKIRFLGQRAGGMDKLKGLKIAHVHSDSDFAREVIPILDAQAAQSGFAVQHLAVKSPGLDQKAIWLRVQVAQPDWVILRIVGGVGISTALKEAAQVGVPRDKMVGWTATCAEQEMVRAGEAAIGFICGTWYGTERHFPLMQEILQYVYARGKGAGPQEEVGTANWIFGVLRGLLIAEALRTAMHHFGQQPLTGAQVQWGLEHLSLTTARLKELGVEGLLAPFSLSCRDHEGGGSVRFQQWDGTQWRVISDWIAPDQALVQPLVEASAAKYAQEKGITPRDCP
jgi:branched-chain amino acid transport system substrate-binding protein